MDTLAGVPEAVEVDFSEAILARDDAVAALAAGPAGIGPPDLAWLQKGRPGKEGAGGGGGKEGGGGSGASASSSSYYHHVLGGEVSAGAVAGYFASLLARAERPGALAGWWQGAPLAVQRGFYCCYDFLSRTDLRCELCVPGGVVCGAVDAAGNLREAGARLWRQARVSAFVRAVLVEPEMALGGGGVLVQRDALPTPAAERELLAAVEALYADGTLPGGAEAVAEAQGYGAAPEHADPVLFALLHHFRSRQRWAAARAFFARLRATSYPAAAVWEAAALRGAAAHGPGGSSAAGAAGAGAGDGGAADVGELLQRALEAAPDSAPLLAALADECLRLQQVDTAARLARRAVRARPRCRPAWLLLARCYAAEGRHAEALVALNAVPTPPLPRDERELLLVAPPPEPARVTAPARRGYDADLEAARALALEDGAAGAAGAPRLLAFLPGAVLLNREPPGSGPWPDASPNRVTRAVLGAVYAQLQALVAPLGWVGWWFDAFCFFLRGES